MQWKTVVEIEYFLVKDCIYTLEANSSLWIQPAAPCEQALEAHDICAKGTVLRKNDKKKDICDTCSATCSAAM